MASTLAQVARVALTKAPSHARVVVPTAMAQKMSCELLQNLVLVAWAELGMFVLRCRETIIAFSGGVIDVNH